MTRHLIASAFRPVRERTGGRLHLVLLITSLTSLRPPTLSAHSSPSSRYLSHSGCLILAVAIVVLRTMVHCQDASSIVHSVVGRIEALMASFYDNSITGAMSGFESMLPLSALLPLMNSPVTVDHLAW